MEHTCTAKRPTLSVGVGVYLVNMLVYQSSFRSTKIEMKLENHVTKVIIGWYSR